MPPYTHAGTYGLDMIAWDRDDAVQGINAMGMGKIACLYLLVDTTGRRAYVGETGNAAERIASHCRKGPCSGVTLKFDTVVIIWDGRPIWTTRFNDGTVRKRLEAVLIEALLASGWRLPDNLSISRAGVGMAQGWLIEAIIGELEQVLHMVGWLGRPSGCGNGREDVAAPPALVRRVPWNERMGGGGSVVHGVASGRSWEMTICGDLLGMLDGGGSNLRMMFKGTWGRLRLRLRLRLRWNGAS